MLYFLTVKESRKTIRSWFNVLSLSVFLLAYVSCIINSFEKAYTYKLMNSSLGSVSTENFLEFRNRNFINIHFHECVEGNYTNENDKFHIHRYLSKYIYIYVYASTYLFANTHTNEHKICFIFI